MIYNSLIIQLYIYNWGQVGARRGAVGAIITRFIIHL
jgi:hypothetical protein